MLKLPKINSKEAKNEIVNFIQKTVSDANAKGIVVGLSGGIDSSVSGLLAVESLGKENVLGIHMYSSTTPEEDRKHARLMANLLDIKYIEVSIDTISEEFSLVTDIKNMTTLENTDQDTIKIANGNLKARIRMSLLYYYANLKNYIVIGTGNRSELLIGYFTKYGDGGCDIEPIGDIYKTQLRLLAKDWGIPEDIISKPPRACLWPNNSDEDEIGDELGDATVADAVNAASDELLVEDDDEELIESLLGGISDIAPLMESDEDDSDDEEDEDEDDSDEDDEFSLDFDEEEDDESKKSDEDDEEDEDDDK